MVLESLTNPKEAERKPLKMIIYGFIFASIAVILSLWIFKSQSSMVMVLITVITTIPLMYNTMKLEEFKAHIMKKEKILMREHLKALKFFIYLFLGFTIAYSVWFVFLPAETTQVLFSSQLDTISQINSQISGNFLGANVLLQIFTNNLKVLLFCVFFAFFFGAGAIFILTWNATVIGAAAGGFVRSRVTDSISYLHLFPVAIMRYMTHGVFEILAYFTAGLAGGIISVAVIHHDMKSPGFKNVVKDALDLIILAIIVLIVAALIEVYVTPALF
ncbi:stage II sporulation protein M [archaeon]|nr:stage II sporulation protein M [archaeon]